MTAELLTLPRCQPLASRKNERRRSRRLVGWLRRPSEGLSVFALSATVYLTVAIEMLHRGVVYTDATSRVANGFFVLFSRDPHLPAVGFVWNPLPSLLLSPLLALKSVFPVLVRDGFAGNLESVVFMAGSVALLAGCLRRLEVSRVLRLLLVGLFALHPLMITYAGNGESEAVLLFFLLLALRSLIGWLGERQPARLAGTGVALALAYLSRYEAVAPAVAVTLLVALVSAHRATGTVGQRARSAMNDAVLVAFPFIFAFGLWALSSRLLVGSWFPTFSSEYGNAAQVGASAEGITQVTGTTHLAAVQYVLEQLAGLQPFAAPIAVLAVIVAVRRRDLLSVAAPTVLGAVLAFDNLAFLSGNSFGWLRFQITLIPLTALAAGRVLGSWSGSTSPAAQQPRRGRARSVRVPAVLAVFVLIATAAALPISARTLTSHRLAREETQAMLAAFSPARATAEDRRHLLILQTEKQVADDLDAMHLGPGHVLTDSAYSFAVILASSRPKQFVITSDRDFRQAVADPKGHQVRYLLVPEPAFARADAVLRSRPTLYDTGGGISDVVRTWRSAAGTGNWRLLQVRR